MFRTDYIDTPPSKLTDYINGQSGPEPLQFRRRAVLFKPENHDPVLVCCTIEALSIKTKDIERSPSCYYEEVTLFEDWLSPKKCNQFVEQLQTGRIDLGGVKLQSAEKIQWQAELVPLENSDMSRAGLVVETGFEKKNYWSRYPLISMEAPYFPDLSEAARHWLPFPIYRGDSDGRNGKILFLLPEHRSYFEDVTSENGRLTVTVAGAEVSKNPFFVMGAYWIDKEMTSFDAQVNGGKAKLEVPEEADRLEYVLLSSEGERRDYQREDQFRHAGLGRRRSSQADLDLADSVKTARSEGEGPQIEFKPFVNCSEGLIKKGSKTKTKLCEVVTTVVSFANAKGGRIFLGIDNGCALQGVDLAPINESGIRVNL